MIANIQTISLSFFKKHFSSHLMPLALPRPVHTRKMQLKLVVKASLTHGNVIKGIKGLFAVKYIEFLCFKNPKSRSLPLATSYNYFPAYTAT